MSDNLWRRVEKRGPEECWPWIGKSSNRGYGRLGGKIAHRLIYECTIGPIPPGMFVLHRCDNPPCCNPVHLFIGHPRDNSADMVVKGRSSRGEKRPLAKLTDQQARMIRIDARSSTKIAADYGIDFSTVCAIRRNQRWKHV